MTTPIAPEGVLDTDTENASLYEVTTRAAGPSGSLPLTVADTGGGRYSPPSSSVSRGS